jgi:hypothetical protein
LGEGKKLDDRYVWLDFVWNLMKELNKSDEEVYKMNYISALNWLSYFKNKEELKDKNRL